MKLLSKRQQKQLILSLISLGLIIIASIAGRDRIPNPAVQTPPSDYYVVTSFADGDTLTVDINGTKEKVRLIGVDTPEVNDPRKPVQCFGHAASQFTQTLIGTNVVRLESDPTNSDRDRYNRILRYVYLPDNTLVNLEIIKQGYGFAYTTYPFEKQSEFTTTEIAARDQGRGLWGNCQVSEDKKTNADPTQ